MYKNIKSSSEIKRNQTLYTLIATSIAAIGGMLSFLPLFNIQIYPVWNITSIVCGTLLAYAIFRHHLMGINIIIKKTAIYSLVIALVAAGYFSIISLFDYLFVAFIGHPSTFSRVIAVILIAAVFHPLRNKIEAIIDKIFFRTKYDYQQTLLTFSQNLTGFLDLRELLSLLSEVISGTMHVTSVSILLWQKESSSYTMSSYVGLPDNCRHWQFPKESQLISWLSQEKGIAVRSHFYQKPLPPMYRQIIAEMRLLKAAVSLPLIYKGELVAVINIGSKQSGEIYTNTDIELLKTLSNEAAIAISNASLFVEAKEKERLDEELRLGQTIQHSLLPSTPPIVEGLKVSGFMQSAKEIGGDYYDFIVASLGSRVAHDSPMTHDNYLAVVIGDVSGKGVAAGIIMAMAKAVIHTLSQEEISPAQILWRANQILYQNIGGSHFMSFLYFIWDASSKTLTYSSAGHEHILLYRKQTGTIEAIISGGFVLGVLNDIKPYLEEKTLALECGDRILLYSDGAIDAESQSEERFGLERLIATLKKHEDKNVEALLPAIKAEIEDFAGTQPQYDDITLVAMEAS